MRARPRTARQRSKLMRRVAANGILQNLLVEPELDRKGRPRVCRLLARLLRVKPKEINVTEPIRSIIDTANDPHEISLARRERHAGTCTSRQSVRGLQESGGRARFWCGRIAIRLRHDVSHVVLRLGAVSPKLMQAYRDGDLTLEHSSKNIASRKASLISCIITAFARGKAHQDTRLELEGKTKRLMERAIDDMSRAIGNVCAVSLRGPTHRPPIRQAGSAAMTRVRLRRSSGPGPARGRSGSNFGHFLLKQI